ncbi:hypothetical protein [uncultured Psychrosphaera sp.]|uniref:hypothetical protein n=1 Tax=uncultured Psychrosphaera sp. TaxID=1403522 RepID=UPI00261C7988|nr:hypothetical protein [uncultured Psychrosphaera sp.]
MSINNIEEKDVLTQAQELPKELTPKRDLWAGIEQAIAKTPQQSGYETNISWQQFGKIAAAFAPIALVLGIWLSTSNEASVNSNWTNPLIASYEIQKKQLLQNVNLEHPIVNNWQSSMKELELAEKALIKALKNQPEDPALMKMLNQVYQSQISLIQKAYKPQLQTYHQI